MSTIIHPSLNVQRIEHKSLRRMIEIYQNVFCRSLSNINQLMLFYYTFLSFPFSFCLLWLYTTFCFTNKYVRTLTHEQIKPTIIFAFLFYLNCMKFVEFLNWFYKLMFDGFLYLPCMNNILFYR